MPLYEVKCPEHGVVEVVCKSEEKTVQKCEKCGQPMEWTGLQSSMLGKPGFRSGVILSSGEKVEGSFGTRRRKGRDR